MSSHYVSLYNAHCHTSSSQYCTDFMFSLPVRIRKNTPFLVMILILKTSFALPFISIKPSWLLLSFQPSLMAFLILNKLKFGFGFYCISFDVAFNCSFPNLLHQVPAMSMMLLAVMALPWAPTVPATLPSCMSLLPHVLFVQWTGHQTKY